MNQRKFAWTWLGADLEPKKFFILKKAKFVRPGLELSQKESFKVKTPMILLS